jgi:hypothetical protein
MSTRATIRVMDIDFKGNEVKLVDLYKHHDGYIKRGLGSTLVDFFINVSTSNDLFVCDFITWYSNQYNENARLEITDNAEYHSDTEYFYTVYPQQKKVTVKLVSYSNDDVYCCHWSNRANEFVLYDKLEADAGHYRDRTSTSKIVEQVLSLIEEQGIKNPKYNYEGGHVG